MNFRPRRIELRYFAGCPHAEMARRLLQACLKKLALDVPIEEKEGDYPSPTVLIDGFDVTGAAAMSGRLCRVDLPTEAQILSALKKGDSGHAIGGIDEGTSASQRCEHMPNAHTATTATEREEVPQDGRSLALRRGLWLEYMTVGWNVIEGVIAVTAGARAGSIALLAFGIDSFVECASGFVLIWRLSAERRSDSHERIEQLEHSARRLVGLSLFLLAAYVAFDAVKALVTGERPEPSMVGIALSGV